MFRPQKQVFGKNCNSDKGTKILNNPKKTGNSESQNHSPKDLFGER
jgi:hypothetical protein